MAAYATVPPDDPFAVSKAMLASLADELAGPEAAGLTAAGLEELLDERGREVLRQPLQDHYALRAVREEQRAREHPGPVEGADGITRTRLETGHGRALATLFGTVTVTRCAWRKPGTRNFRPADAALSLPAGRHSHSLAKLAAIEAARGSFDTAHAAVARRCGPVIGKRQIEESVVSAAAGIPAFYAARVPEPCPPGTLLILSADGKGVVMRPGALRAATAKAAAKLGKMRTRLTAGEKPNRKRMAALVAVYDAVPAPRRPHDVIAAPGGRAGARPLRPGPKARGKWLAGSVRKDPAEVITAMFDEAEARDPGHLRTWVVLVDGAEHQLSLIRAEAARRSAAIHVVIDIIHVLEYIWGAAWSLHEAGDPAAEDWVAARALAILSGDSDRAAAAITAEIDAAGLAGSRRHGADTCVRYLGNKREYLRYGQAMEAGWPIATGIIEGACRHLIADRLAVSGSRWGLDGAEAVLTLRAVISNGDFPEYWRFHLAREHRRLYPGTAQGQYALGA
ncbi:MAG TPA: ISKra4 family transposase [Streptosporangiaceae bacterium]|nr:ISKra4 family transposase [Streptosporangiaceae bacterium]